MISRISKTALLAACLTAAAIAQRGTTTPPSPDTLDEVTAIGTRERQRELPPPRNVMEPDVINITRNGTTSVRLRRFGVSSQIRFRRESTARLLPDGAPQSMRLQRDTLNFGTALFSDATFQLAPDIDEADGLPALIPFAPNASLINIDYVRLRDTGHKGFISVSNVLDPQTRTCMVSLGIADDEREFPNRFMLVSDRIGDCVRAEKSREGELFFSDGVPEPLRQALRDIYEPVYSRFAAKLGSEPSITFVVWRPAHPRSDFRFERNWNRTNLLLFNGSVWQKGIDPGQQNELWDGFAREQVLRRFPNRSDVFTQSAVDYLFLLAQAERDHATSRRLTAELPVWIATCAGSLSVNAPGARSPPGVSSIGCGYLSQFVYDAVTRAKTRGKDTVFRTWRGLLTESFRRGESAVTPDRFLATSGDAQRILQILTDGSVDWARFATEMDRFGVRVRIAPGQFGPDVEVLSLPNFHD